MAATAGAVKVGVDSVALPGQLVGMPPTAAYVPYAFESVGQGVEYPSPSAPPAMSSLTPFGGPSPITSVGGSWTAAARGQAAVAAGAQPFNARVSAVIPAVVGLIGSLFLLHWVFFRGNAMADVGAS